MGTSDMRKAFIESAIHVVACNGIDRTTTKALATHAGLNEAYIYRVFGGKEELLKETFDVLDIQFRDCILRNIGLMYDASVPLKERSWNFFKNVWDFTLNDPEKCSFFIRYYHSRFFDTYSIKFRRQTYDEVMKQFTPAFKEEIDVWLLLNHIFDVLFASVIKILRNEVENDERMAISTFALIYMAVEPYFALNNK